MPRRRGRDGHQAQFDQLEPESHHPLDDLPQGRWIRQSDAKGGRVLTYADLTVVKLRTYYRACSTLLQSLLHPSTMISHSCDRSKDAPRSLLFKRAPGTPGEWLVQRLDGDHSRAFNRQHLSRVHGLYTL
jgi:hypothetical protein